MAAKSKVNDVAFRRTWDESEYEEKARKREEDKAVTRVEKPVATEMLKPRDAPVELDVNVGKVSLVTKEAGLDRGPGYYCDLCDCTLKDSKTYLGHLNGRKHQAMKGMSMKVERSTVEQVANKFKELKRKREEGKPQYDLKKRLAEARAVEDAARQARKERKRQRKETEEQRQSTDGPSEFVVQQSDMASVMGFASFA